tara:strand:+ start:1063 stop:1533 length:471 start_codon:yes stop_codon:yes gene_type:complete
MHRVSNGLSAAETKKSHEALREVLSNTFVLYVKTLNYHWHVIGPHFISYHELFKDQYEDLFEAIDLLAERVRALGHNTPSGCAQMLEYSSISESESNLSADDMIAQLVDDHFILVKIIRKNIVILEQVNDYASADMLIERLQEHEKMAWFLQSHLL